MAEWNVEKTARWIQFILRVAPNSSQADVLHRELEDQDVDGEDMLRIKDKRLQGILRRVGQADPVADCQMLLRARVSVPGNFKPRDWPSVLRSAVRDAALQTVLDEWHCEYT